MFPAAAGHADTDGVSDQIARVIVDRPIERLPVIHVILFTQVEAAKLFD
jgi:hypothetical protein